MSAEADSLYTELEDFIKVYGDGGVSEDMYEMSRRQQIEAGLPTWIAERTPFGGLHIQYWNNGEHLASLIDGPTDSGFMVVDIRFGDPITGYLPLGEAVRYAEISGLEYRTL